MLRFLLLMWFYFSRSPVTGGKVSNGDEECNRADPFGVQDPSIIPDSHLTSTSQEEQYPAYHGRLGHLGKAWCAATHDKNQSLQIDLAESKEIIAINVEGLSSEATITEYYFQFSVDLDTWYCFQSGGKVKVLSLGINMLMSRPIARYARINPQKWVGKICARVELYGCSLEPTSSFTYPLPMQGSCDFIPTTQPTTISTTADTTTEHAATTNAVVPITNIEIRLSSTIVKSGEAVHISLYYHQGDNVEYKWDMGNGSPSIYRNLPKPFSWSYSNPGVYTISLVAYNTVSNATDAKQLVVQEEVEGLRLVDTISPMVPGTRFLVSWNIDKGTNVTFTLAFGDEGEPTVITTMEKRHGPFASHYNYSKPGQYTFKITATNRVTFDLKLSSLIIVERPIEGLTAQWTTSRPFRHNQVKLYLAEGERVSVQANSSGTDPQYEFHFGEKIIGNLTSGNLSYAFSSIGTLSASVTCFNHINSVVVRYERLFVIQEDQAIKNLNIIHVPTAFGTPVEFTSKIETGTAFYCEWSFGDGNGKITDVGNFHLHVYNNYSSNGSYFVRLCCHNRHGDFCTNTTAIVEIPIGGLIINFTGRSVLNTSTIAAFDLVIQKGTGVTCGVFMHNGNMTLQVFQCHIPILQRIQTFEYNFTSQGVYSIGGYARNALGQENITIEKDIIVQDPILEMTLMGKSPVKLSNSTVSFIVTFLDGRINPTNVSCVWNFGDNFTSVINVAYRRKKLQKHFHRYQSEGIYHVQINCSNLVSSITAKTSVIVHKLRQPILDITKKLTNASKNSIYYILWETLQLCVTPQRFDRSYTWHTSVKNTVNVTTLSPCLTYVIEEVGVHKVHVRVNNILESLESKRSFIAQAKISGLKINVSGDFFVREEIRVYWSANNFGTDSCFFLDFNDNSPLVAFGPTVCSTKTPQTTTLINLSDQTVVLYRRKYQKEGKFNVTITGTNEVSSTSESICITITKRICEIKNLTILHNNTSFKKSDAFQLQVNYSVHCVLADSVGITWKVQDVEGRIETDVEFPLETGDDHSEKLMIAGKSLDYGTYKFSVLLTLKGVVVKELYGDVFRSHSLEIYITKSELQPRISGGRRQEVDPESLFVLDGRESYDPDDMYPTFQLTYRWYCKTTGDLDNYIGCYSQYPRPSDVIWQWPIFYTNSNEFQRSKSYIFTLEITKDTRTATIEQEVFVTYGRPLAVKVTCQPECTGRLMSARSLILASSCGSCSNPDHLNYKWGVYEIAKTKSSLVDIPPSKATFGFHGSKFEVKPDVFKQSNSYIVVHSAWISGGTPGTANYTFYVYENSAPSSGNCTISPSYGTAMKTTFVMLCRGWVDSETPLLYTFFYEIHDLRTILYTGKENQWSFKLPLVHGKENSSLVISADVQDSFGLATKTNTSVLVMKRTEEKVDISEIMNQIDQMDGTSSATSSNASANTPSKTLTVAEMIQIANAIIYSLNQDSQTEREDKGKNSQSNISNAKIRIREKVVLQLMDMARRVQNDTKSSGSHLDLISSALKDCTVETNELSSIAVVASIDALLELATILDKSPALAKVVAVKLVHVAGNIMTTRGSTELSVSEASKATKKIRKAIDLVANAVLRRKSIGEKSTEIRTPQIYLVLERNDESTIGNRTWHLEEGSIKLPVAERMDFNSSGNTIVDVQIVEFPNLFRWSAFSKRVTSKIIYLALKRKDGSKYDIIAPRGDIQIIFPVRQVQRSVKQKSNYSVSPVNATVTQFHRFNLTESDKFVTIAVTCDSTSALKWSVLLYPERVTTSDGYFQKWDLVSAPNETEKLHTFQLTRFTWNQGADYYVMVKPLLSADERQLWVSRELNMSYSLRIYTSTCWYWDEIEDTFSSRGLEVGPLSTNENTQCFTNHLASFASQFYVIPHSIDFQKALVGFLYLKGSYVPFAVVMVIFVIYLVLLIWARRKDIKDSYKAEPVIIRDSHQAERFAYEITVFTGLRRQSGTTSNVYCTLKGDLGQTKTRLLKDPSRLRFQRAEVDTFILTSPINVGDLTHIRVWHNNTGVSPSWYLNKISVRDLTREKLYYFLCNRWFAVEHDDGQVDRTIPVAKKKDIEAFTHIFCNVAQKNITDVHLWLSIFIRPAKSTFTRVQRLSCCTALLYCTMVTNIMFYKSGALSIGYNWFKIGPLSFSTQQLYVGIASSLIMFPASLFFVAIFRSVGPKGQRELKTDSTKSSLENAPEVAGREDFSDLLKWYIAGQKRRNSVVSQLSIEDDIVEPYSETRDMNSLYCDDYSSLHAQSHVTLTINENTERNRQLLKKGKTLYLPHWCIFVCWFGVISFAFTSAIFVCLYGFKFEEEEALWLASVIVSIFQDVFISQPLKVLAIALFSAFFLKKLDDNSQSHKYDKILYKREPNQETNGTMYEAMLQKALSLNQQTQPPDTKELEKAREKRLNEIQMDLIIKELIVYVLFLASLLVVGYAHRDPQAFQVAKLMMNTYIGGSFSGNGLTRNDGVNNYWSWIEGTVLPSLTSDKRSWARGCEPPAPYSIDCNSLVVGTARLRQVRVPAGSCTVHETMENVTDKCNGFYSFFDEDTSHYFKRWKKMNNSKANDNNPWIYNSTMELGGLPYMGQIATYSGGGYTVSLHNTHASLDELRLLQKHSWIDQRTRALLLEISVYNAQVNLFGIATFLTEWLPTNGILYFNNVKVARLYVTGGGLQSLTIACNVFLVIFFLSFIYDEMKQMYNLRREYFKDIWNWLEVTLIVLIAGCSATIVKRSHLTNIAINEIEKEHNKFVSLIPAATADELLTYFEGLLVFVANVKLLKLCRFNHRILIFTKTLSTAVEPLISFLLVFFVFYIGFSSVYFLIFGRTIYEYRSFLSTIETLFSTLLGGFDYNATADADGIFGPALFFSFMMIMVMILMNVFLTIIMDAFAEIQGDDSLKTNKYEIIDHIMLHIKRILRRNNTVQVFHNDDINTAGVEDYLGTINEMTILEKNKVLNNYNKVNFTTQTEFHAQEKPKPGETATRVILEKCMANTEMSTQNDLGDDDGDSFDALDFAIVRATRREQEAKKALDDVLFDFKQYNYRNDSHETRMAVGGVGIEALSANLDKKIHNLTVKFASIALDDIIVDNAYEMLFRFYLQDTENRKLQEKIKLQNDLERSWQRQQINHSKPDKIGNMYSRHAVSPKV